MAFDLLPIREGDKITYKTTVNAGRPDQEMKDVEISEKDGIWIENRHRHMKDTIEKLMGDFQRFIDSNPHFTKSDSDNANSLNAIKDMLAGLPQFQELKEAYSLHLSMAQECMNMFQSQKLPDVASVEQILATGLDEDYRKPKNLTDQVVRTLDDDGVTPPDRLRLLALYLIFRDGILPADLERLIHHSQLQMSDLSVLQNLELLGVRTTRALKETRLPPPAVFPFKPPLNVVGQEEYALSRYEPALRQLLSAHASSTVDPQIFPYTKPPLEADTDALAAATSLRTAKPTWAKKTTSSEPRQRVIVYVAGGATYSESRACYEASSKHNKEIVLVTSHMHTPALFMRQLGDLSADKRRLGIPADGPQPKAPAHLFERDDPPPARQQQQHHAGAGHTGHHGRSGQPGQPQVSAMSEFDRAAKMRPPEPPTGAMAGMRLDTSQARQNGTASMSPSSANSRPAANKLSKEPEKKKKHHFFGKSK
ncbi:hypothetical protein ANO11243_082210 [Dothideomycetidae sp. 11243]|nr:hypothetical protein ANO11243_082210 [fungal sp. No.11243]